MKEIKKLEVIYNGKNAKNTGGTADISLTESWAKYDDATGKFTVTKVNTESEFETGNSANSYQVSGTITFEGKEITPEDIIKELKDMGDLKKALQDKKNRDKVKELEDTYKELTGITVTVGVDSNTHGDFKQNISKINVVGAAFNAQPGSSLTLQFSKPAKDAEIDGTKYKKNNAVQVDIDLLGIVNSSKLDYPIAITVPIPSGISAQDFWILHYHKDGTYEAIKPVINGDGTCTFIVDSFSVFVFADGVGSSSGSGSGSSYKPSSASTPRTGDFSPLWIFALLAVSAAGAAGIIAIRKKGQKATAK